MAIGVHEFVHAHRVAFEAEAKGTLERSGVASVDAGALRAAVSYDTPYAVYQHEGLDFAHPNGRRSKYLEGPLNSEHAKCEGIIAAEIRKSLGA